MAEVVKLKQAARIDLRGDNRLPVLLDERERLRAELSALQASLKELDTELRAKLGDAKQMVTAGWLVSQTVYTRKEFTMPAATMRRISVRRTGKRIHKQIHPET